VSEQAWFERLKALRKGAGLRQEDVAKHLGVARTTYLYIEAGVRPPDYEELTKIAALYGLSVDEVFSIEITREPEPTLERQWVCITSKEAKLLQLVRADDLRGAMESLLEVITGS